MIFGGSSLKTGVLVICDEYSDSKSNVFAGDISVIMYGKIWAQK